MTVDRVLREHAGIEKRGGYSGGKPASTLRPPAKLPSGSFKPQSQGSASKATDRTK
jgi:hypothetical protein